MELDDCAFPLLAGHRHHRRRQGRRSTASNVALLVGARPRTKGMERADLLEANGGIFKPQGEAINAGAADDMKVLVVGNPANTNALIAQSQRARRPARALHRDDAPGPQPRDRAARAEDRRRRVADITNMAVWGNHSPTMYPDLFNAKVGGRSARRGGRRRASGTQNDYIPTRRQARRGDHRGARRVLGRVGRQRRRSTTCTTGCNGTRRRRLGLDGRAVRRLLRRRRGDHLLASRAPASGGEWSIVEGLEVQRLRAGADRRDGQRAPGGARGGRRSSDWSDRQRVDRRVAPISHYRRPHAACQPRPDFVTLPSSARAGITRYR